MHVQILLLISVPWEYLVIVGLLTIPTASIIKAQPCSCAGLQLFWCAPNPSCSPCKLPELNVSINTGDAADSHPQQNQALRKVRIMCSPTLPQKERRRLIARAGQPEHEDILPAL
jgi:hypothetical protein